MIKQQHWHIFCRVIDNFGDIGVCWRLAQQLYQNHAQALTLWVDDLVSLKALHPQADITLNSQLLSGVQVQHWQSELSAKQLQSMNSAQIVIEAFGCELPEPVLAQMRAMPTQPLWLNLEYLSAEPWVEGFHGRSSPVHGMQKIFFFPGFSAHTGGLLWDESLLNLPTQMHTAEARAALFVELGIAPALATRPLQISLFAYENPQLPKLLKALSQHQLPVHLLVPEGRISADVQGWLVQSLSAGQTLERGALAVTALPFMAQPCYDRLLASCQLNLVRGEESFVRAQMLGLPMLWHIYQQEENAHLVKLEAFLDSYLEGAANPLSDVLRSAFRAWNQPELVTDWSAVLQLLPDWAIHAKAWQQRQKKQGNLAQNLVNFAQTGYSAAHF